MLSREAFIWSKENNFVREDVLPFLKVVKILMYIYMKKQGRAASGSIPKSYFIQLISLKRLEAVLISPWV